MTMVATLTLAHMTMARTYPPDVAIIFELALKRIERPRLQKRPQIAEAF